jgi:CheY-like chemotaxis protein
VSLPPEPQCTGRPLSRGGSGAPEQPERGHIPVLARFLSEADTTSMPSMDRPTALIVDDHAGFRAIARDLLTVAGLDVVAEAADGASALHAFDRHAPAVVLLDIRLPDMDGFAVARALAGRPAPPVVVLVSSRDAADFGRRVAMAGVAGFISKSRLSPDTLHAILGGTREETAP